MIRGLSLSTLISGTSALKSCMPPEPIMGQDRRARTMIPIRRSMGEAAPEHDPTGYHLTSVRTEAPVVVNPDMDSK